MQFQNRQSQTISNVEVQRPIPKNSGMGRITCLPQKRKSQLPVPNLPNRCVYIQHCESPIRINVENFAGQSPRAHRIFERFSPTRENNSSQFVDKNRSPGLNRKASLDTIPYTKALGRQYLATLCSERNNVSDSVSNRTTPHQPMFGPD